MAIAHVQTTTTTSTAAASSITKTSFAVGSGPNRTLVAAVIWRDSAGSSPTVSSVVFNTSESFTYRTRRQVNFATNQYLTVEIWTRDNPTNTTANVVATLSEAVTAENGIALIVSEYTGANNGVGATGTNSGTSTHPSVTFTTQAATGLIYGAVCQQQSTDGTYTPGTGVTERVDGGAAIGSADSCMYWAGEKAATGASDTIDATHSTSSVRWAIAAVEIKEAVTSVSKSEGVTLGEAVTVNPPVLGNTYQVSKSEGLTLGESRAVGAPYLTPGSEVSKSEGVTLGEAATVSLAAALSISKSEGLTLGEVVLLPSERTTPFLPLSRVEYEVWLDDDRGNRLALLDTLRSFSCVRVANGVGRGTVTLGEDADLDKLLVDRLIEIWRAPENGDLQLEMAFFIRGIQVYEGQAGRTVVVSGPDGNDLLRRRIVAYAAGTSQASKTAAADDLIKALVRENLGSSAAAARSLDSLDFDVETDTTMGPTVTKSCAWKNVLDVLQEVAQTSLEKGTRLYFWVEPQVVGDTLGFRFRTSPEQPGVDRTEQGNLVVFGTEWGNLENLELTYNYGSEVTYVYAGGQGNGAEREIQETEDAGRSGASAWNRIEAFVEATNEPTATGVLDKAEQRLRDGAPTTTVRGALRDTAQFRYGVDWLFGDRVPVSLFGREYDTVIESVTVQVNENGKEEITSGFELII